MGLFGLSWGSRPTYIERTSDGNWFTEIFSTLSIARTKLTEKQKLDYVLSNPALLKVIAITADLGSLGKVNRYKEEELIEKDFLHSFVQRPNFKQGWSQFFWEYFFWIQFGTAYLYNPLNAKVLKENNPIQWLVPNNIVWNISALDRFKAFFSTRASLKEVMKAEVIYSLGNGQTIVMSLQEIVPFYDLCSGIEGNPYKGESRIDALYKVIKNSELGLDAKSINLEFLQKFMVSGQSDPGDVSQIPMAEPEKRSIEEMVRSFKKIHATKSKISIERFVENFEQLKLDESFDADMLKMGSIMNVPKEVLDILKEGSTYENQEKATGRQVEYSVKPKWKQLLDWFESQYGFQDIRVDYSELSFNQVFEKERADKEKTKAETMLLLAKAGIPEDQINAFLGTNFKGIDYEAAQRQPTTNSQSGTNQQGVTN